MLFSETMKSAFFLGIQQISASVMLEDGAEVKQRDELMLGELTVALLCELNSLLFGSFDCDDKRSDAKDEVEKKRC